MTRDNLSLYLYSLVMHVRDIRRYIVYFLYVNALFSKIGKYRYVIYRVNNFEIIALRSYVRNDFIAF